MKHYYGYTSDGTLYWSFVNNGGFPDDCHLDDPTCTHELSVHCRAVHNVNMTADEILDGIVVFECPCLPSEGVCDCVSTKRQGAYYCHVNSCLVDKPVTTVLIDNISVAHNSLIAKTPGVLFTVKLTSTAPDGATACISQNALKPDNDPVDVTFLGGVSTEVTFRVPAQGVDGRLMIVGKYTDYIRITVRGFAT